ncbi:MFS transporter [Nocardia pseudobrasiliensis]|uniref:EmrB/QacA subfamily drug resistance transporter n=1 Tax=Nocardia pseudobrasiliensis TaxID=45979 RepID=A0A370I9T2_9NOCA|nr:MFS transporter [Nocardia pseudobrasiliensis]RDI66154.1 EmrB/QacA subfamily drug resistance transporter [Nocardia pseudobrasiliensis]
MAIAQAHMDIRDGGASWSRRRALLAVLACSIPEFMVALDNLVVSNALVPISRGLHADEAQLQWVVNAYTLSFASLLLTGAALGDRFGRRRVFLAGLALFMAGSIVCGLSGTVQILILGRIIQGAGAAAAMPLSLTLIAESVRPEKRSAAVGLWSAMTGLGTALGPVIGGAITQGLAWQWIFWINIPVGVVAFALIVAAVRESEGPDKALDLPGVVMGGGAVLLTVWAIVNGHRYGWGSPLIDGAFVAAAALLIGFVLWERRTPDPLLPLRFYRIPSFVLSNVVSATMYFGLFGAIFLMVQYLQTALGYNAFEAGLRTLPWSLGPLIAAPLAGLVTDRVGGGRLMALGMTLDAIALGWLALIGRADLPYTHAIPALVIGGIGMGIVWTPVTAVVLASVRPSEQGKASGANSTVREVGGALGIAVCTSVVAHYSTPIHSFADIGISFSNGMRPALWLSVCVLLVGAAAGAAIPRRINQPQEVRQ